jgi:hypothetical protein
MQFLQRRAGHQCIPLTPRFSAVIANAVKSQPLQRFSYGTEKPMKRFVLAWSWIITSLKRGVNKNRK